MSGKRIILAVVAAGLVLTVAAGIGLASWALWSEGAPSGFRAAAVSGVVGVVKTAAAAVRTAEKWTTVCDRSCGLGSAIFSARGDGALTGNFDDSVSGGCQRACAVQGRYRREQVSAQPGAAVGNLTQCPVSGVVFEVKRNSARFAYGGQPVYTCCGGCEMRLKSDPARFLLRIS